MWIFWPVHEEFWFKKNFLRAVYIPYGEQNHPSIADWVSIILKKLRKFNVINFKDILMIALIEWSHALGIHVA